MKSARVSLTTALAVAAGLMVEAAPVPLPEVPPRPADIGAYRGGPARSGYFPGAKLPQRPAVLWTFETQDAPSAPVVAGGVVYLLDGAGTASALDSGTGAVLWQSRDPGRRRYIAAPHVAGGQVILATGRGVEALDRASGHSRWQFPVPGGVAGAALALGGRVFAGGIDGTVYALHAATGAPVWRRDILADAPPPLPGFMRCLPEVRATPQTPASDGEVLYLVVSDQRRVLALDLDTGRRRWSYLVEGEHQLHCDSAVVEGAVVGHPDGRVLALDRVTGRRAGELRRPVGVWTVAAAREGEVYAGGAAAPRGCLDGGGSARG